MRFALSWMTAGESLICGQEYQQFIPKKTFKVIIILTVMLRSCLALISLAIWWISSANSINAEKKGSWLLFYSYNQPR